MPTIILVIGLVVLFAHFLSLQFRKANISHVLILMLVDIIIPADNQYQKISKAKPIVPTTIMAKPNINELSATFSSRKEKFDKHIDI